MDTPEKKDVNLSSSISRMNLAEREELERLGYKVDSTGKVTTTRNQTEQKGQSVDPEKTLTRRDFIRHLVTATFIGTSLAELTFPSPILAKTEDEISDTEQVEADSELILKNEIERILQNRTGGFYLERRDPNTGVMMGKVEHNSENPLPVASAFKAFVLGAYLELIPKEEWVFDRSSDLFNMVVYSHNVATGNLLHLVAEKIRQTEGASTDQNDLVLFNTYLESHKIPGMVGTWGFNSPTDGQSDPSKFRDVTVRNSKLEAANTATPSTLKDGYTYFLDTLKNGDPSKLELFKYMLSLRDMRFLSPLEANFLKFPLYSKDGYLTPGTFPGYGSARVDAGCIDLPDGTQLILNLQTFNESDVVANQIADAVAGYVESICQKLETPSFPNWSPETQQLIHERYRYRYANEKSIDQPGILVPEQKSLEWLSSACEAVSGGEQLGGLVTINISTGEASILELDENRVPQVQKTFVGLVGERLSYGDPKVSESFANSKFAQQGHYDSDKGIMWQNRQDEAIPQHSLTTPMVAIVDSVSAAAGFGDLNTITPVPFLVMKCLTGNQSEGFALTERNSEVTVHAMPELPATDPGFQHYSARREVTEKVNNLYAEGVAVQDGHDPYWSHACVNLLPEHFEAINQFIKKQTIGGKKVAVVLSYQGLTDLQKLSFPKNYNLLDHPFYRKNLDTSTGKSFSEISR